MTKRKSISKRLRFEVFKRDRFTCQYCSAKPPKVPLEIDHIHPVSKGGSNDIDNLITACFDCNRGKSDVELNVVPPSLSDTLKRKRLAQEQYKDYKRVLKEESEIIESEIDDVEMIYSVNFEDYVFKDRFRITVKRFIQELGIEEVIDAMEVACNKMYFNEQEVLKYFCGVCWTKIRAK